VQLANDIKVLMHWLSHDILALAGPSLEERQELFDFIVELSQRKANCTTSSSKDSSQKSTG